MTSSRNRPAPQLVAGPAELTAAVGRMAAEISTDHPAGVTLVGVLKGSVVLLADLARRLSVPARIEFVSIAPYDGQTIRTRVVKDLDGPIAGEAVVVVTGTVDTGLSADFLRRHLSQGRPRTLRLATLADKRARRLVSLDPDYVAIHAPDAFLVGYGLDYRGQYRNLDALWATDGAALADDPDLHVATLYGSAR